MQKHIIIISLSIATFNGIASGYYLEPISPALAARYTQAMVYKGLADRYREVIDTIEQLWQDSINLVWERYKLLPTTIQQANAYSTDTTEDNLETLFATISKTDGFQNVDTFLQILNNDIRVLEQLEKTSHLPTEAAWLPQTLYRLRAILSFGHRLITDHRLYQFNVELHATVSGIFSREIALLKGRQIATLNTYMRSSQHDYAKELTLWIERIKIMSHMLRSKYPRLAQEIGALLKNCEGLKSIYTKL